LLPEQDPAASCMATKEIGWGTKGTWFALSGPLSVLVRSDRKLNMRTDTPTPKTPLLLVVLSFNYACLRVRCGPVPMTAYANAGANRPACSGHRRVVIAYLRGVNSTERDSSQTPEVTAHTMRRATARRLRCTHCVVAEAGDRCASVSERPANWDLCPSRLLDGMSREQGASRTPR